MIINIISSNKKGGAELLVHELQKIFLKKGMDAFAYYFEGDSSILNKNEKILNIKPRDPRNIFKIRKILKKHKLQTSKPLIVHAHLTWPFFFTVLASLGLKNINLVYTEHSTYNKRRSLPFLKYIEYLFYSKFKKIICISEGVANSLNQWTNKKLTDRLEIIPNGSRVFDLLERSPLSERKPKLISIGSLTSKKNFITTVKTLSLMSDIFETYTIIGEGPERKNLEEEIKKQKMQKKIILCGWSNSIQENLYKADIQLIPSLWEGFGLVAVEGMSTGLPIIASDVDGLREVLNKKNPAVSLINNPTDIQEWQLKINMMINKVRKEGFYNLSKAANIQAKQFSLDIMADKYIATYDNVINYTT